MNEKEKIGYIQATRLIDFEEHPFVVEENEYMKKQCFNSEWNIEEGVKDVFASMMDRSNPKAATLPHDAMISEERSADCPNANQTGYYPSKTYTYTKRFHAPMEWENQQVLLEFEGVRCSIDD